MRRRLTPTLVLLAAAAALFMYAKRPHREPPTVVTGPHDPFSGRTALESADPPGWTAEPGAPPELATRNPDWPSVPFDAVMPDTRPEEGAKGELSRAPDAPPLIRLGLDPARIPKIDAITLLAFKEEQRVEIWIRAMGDMWRKQKEFPFTGFSGGPGPKLREGDGQIPEGIYRIEYLNPNSSYHLSLKIDYPNAFDRRMAKRDGRSRLGGDIFLHGKDVTIGCIPLGDPAIEEVFELVSLVGKNRVDVIIAPRDFRTQPANLEVPGITWETELYVQIAAALQPFSLGDRP
jgi:hypothetical protein